MTIKAWAKGPVELLQHGLEHLDKGTDFDRRMAMIVIDNAVEVAIKTHLSLPERASGIHVPYRRYEEASQSFPKLLDCLEEFSSDKLVGLDLADFEWHHRLRNTLYHEGNGITVERTHVEVYAGIAKQLLANLYDIDKADIEARPSSVGEFLENWAELERNLRKRGIPYVKVTLRRDHAARELAEAMVDAGVLPESFLHEVLDLSQFRNEIAHGGHIPGPNALRQGVQRVRALSETLRRL